MLKITKRTYIATNNLVSRLSVNNRWSLYTKQEQYSELAKLALNNLITFFIANEAEHAGEKIKWINFPKVAFYRAFERAYVLGDSTEKSIEEICSLSDGKITRAVLDNRVKEVITQNVDSKFSDFICSGINTYEHTIYKAATKIATYMEYLENSHNELFDEAYDNIKEELAKYRDVHGFRRYSNRNSPEFNVIRSISRLRNQSRWRDYFTVVHCPVLGHLMDTAMFAFLMSLESNPNDEEEATRMFFMGIFHDVAEAWTKDMTSVTKDAIKYLRKTTEIYEEAMLEEKVYSMLPSYLIKPIKMVDMEAEENKYVKPFMKGADYLSADSECFRQLVGGSIDGNFKRAMKGTRNKFEEGKIVLTPEALAFHNYLYEMFRDTKTINYDEF